MPSRVLVTGASGDIGSQVLTLLRTEGVDVRAVSRDPDRVAAWHRAGIDAREADLTRLDEALHGCDQLFLLSAPGPRQLEQDRAAVDAAVRVGVGRVVRISASDASPGSPAPWAAAHARADAHLAASGLPFVVLRPSAFMSNLLGAAPAIRAGFLPHTSGSGTAGWIDTADVARCVVAVLGSGTAHDGRTVVLTGPRRLSMPDIARQASAVLPHRVRPVFLPGPLYRLFLRATGVDDWMARGLVAQFADVLRSGRDEPPLSDEVLGLSGRAPTAVDEYLRDRPEFRRR